MPARDCFDLPVTGADHEATDGYARYAREFLSYGANIRNLFAVTDAAPGSALLNAHAAALHLAFEGAEGWNNAAAYLRRMDNLAGQATEREQLFCSAVSRWHACDYFSALAILDELTVRWPADLCAIKWGQYHAFNLGDQAALLRLGMRARIVHAGNPYVHGMIAFALEQNHRLEEAEQEGLRATEIAIDDAWAHHAVAHVMGSQRRWDDGARWMDHCAHTWEDKGVFIRDHNWWHAALFRLGQGRHSEALAIFDERLWGEWPEFPQEQIGAISMLWRLEMRGVDVGARWRPVVEEVHSRAHEHYFPFHDIHYIFALARGGQPREADELLRSMRAHADALDGRAHAVWAEVCAPCAEGALAFARGDYDRAAGSFASALPRLAQIGGSHAQRHLFVEAFEASRRGGGVLAATR